MSSLRRLSNRNSIIAAHFHNQTAPHPTSAHYDHLINAAGRDGDFPAVRRLLYERISRGLFNTASTFKFINTNIYALDDLLQSLAAIGGDWFARKHAHDALVAQLARSHLAAEALRVAGIMAERGYGATAATFRPIIGALAHGKDMAAAWRAVEAMRACGLGPDRASFGHILTAQCCAGDVSAAADTVARMEAEGVEADAVTYDALALGACRAGMVEAAVAVVRRMVGEGKRPLHCSHMHIVKEMVGRGYYAQAVEYVRVFAGKNEKLDAMNYGFLARRLRMVKRTAEAEAVVEEMVRRGLPVDDKIIAGVANRSCQVQPTKPIATLSQKLVV